MAVATSAPVAAGFSAASAAAVTALHELLALQGALVAQNPAIAEAADAAEEGGATDTGSRKRPRSDAVDTAVDHSEVGCNAARDGGVKHRGNISRVFILKPC